MILSSSLLGALAIVVLSDWRGGWFSENGPWEMLQIGALLGAAIVFSRASLNLDGWAGRLALGLALFSLLFLVRELPRCGSPFYEAGPCMPGGTKTLGYVLPLLLWIGLVWRSPALGPRALRRSEFRALPRFVLGCLPLLLVLGLLIVGQVADGRDLPMLEEFSELAAYLLLALAALAAGQEADRRADGSAVRSPSHVWSRA